MTATLQSSPPVGPAHARRGRPDRAAVRRAILGDRPAAPLTPTLLSLVWAALALSALAAWFVLYGLVFSGLQQSRNNDVLYSQLRQGLSGATTPIGGVIAPGTPIALFTPGNTGLASMVVIEGTAPSDLRNGPGRRRDTPLPGQPGVSVLFGRSVTYGGPFGGIGSLKAGQTFRITTGQGDFSYTVDRVRHPGDPLPTALATGGSRVMLETSTGFGFGRTDLVFVDATLRGKSVPAAGAVLADVPAAEQAMGTDSSGLIRLVLWVQLLLLVSAAVVWARLRWGAAQAWLVGVPLVVAVLWGATGNVLLLLPNLV